jgi:hypothetical protein
MGRDVEALKPGEGDEVVEEPVRRLCNSWGFVEDEYWPGSRRTFAPRPDEVSETPTARDAQSNDFQKTNLLRTGGVGKAFKALACNAHYR